MDLERWLSRRAAKQRKKSKGKALQYTITSLLEWRLAAVWAGYSWDAFLALPGNFRWSDPTAASDCKAWVLESYRIAQALDAMQRDGSWG